MLRNLIERAIALAALLVFSPVLGLAAMAVALESGRPVFFRQQRVGKQGKVFYILKLRSMRTAGDAQ